VELKGPLPKLEYKANFKKEIAFVAGGTGVTPCLQVIEEILNNPNDKTKITLLFANSTEQDILLREKLNAFAAQHENFRVFYTVDHPSPKWRGYSGFVNKELLTRLLPDPKQGNDILVYVCGPPGFYKVISGGKNPKDYSQGELTGFLKELGYTENQVFKF